MTSNVKDKKYSLFYNNHIIINILIKVHLYIDLLFTSDVFININQKGVQACLKSYHYQYHPC